ncbi:uncharacterized protein [Nicotiana tomentosiformis]|uniref:uncharacterized protein n=1 Tax=Nicotiana tomentosiformis TaxID=4098 RepID=UPI001446A26A|nr:uncharacterized protein LOC104090251 [Nicotiana tomentosiformis]
MDVSCDLEVDVNGIPKPKRYEKFQKSIQSALTSQDVAQPLSTTESTSLHFDDAPQLTSFIQPTARPTPSDSQGASKILKVKKRGVLNLSNGERFVVYFDDTDSSIGEGQDVFAGFCGILATDCSIFPIHFEKWKNLPVTIFNRCYERFIKETCKRNAEIRKKQTVLHIGGSKPNSRRRAEKMAETGQKPGRGQLYLAIHRNEDGSYVNEAAKEICKKIELALSQSTVDESKILPNDVVGKVMGKEHPGRVRCLGLGVVLGRSFRQTKPRYSDLNASSYNNGSCSSQCQEKYNQMLNAHNQSQENYREMMNTFKAYMIIK